MFCRIEAFLLLFSPTFPLLVGDERYQIRGENALSKMKGWLIHSDWNVKNKLLLIEAELHNTMKDFDMAESCYEANLLHTNLLGFSTWKGGNAKDRTHTSKVTFHVTRNGVPLL